MGRVRNCLLEPSIHLWHESRSCTHFDRTLEAGEMVVWVALDLGNTCYCRRLLFLAYRLRLVSFFFE